MSRVPKQAISGDPCIVKESTRTTVIDGRRGRHIAK
jgi:hypothetical protein